jgi:NitT/TauT family transport system substrate-binding protein
MTARSLLALLLVALMLVGCSGSDPHDPAAPLTLTLNWKPEPEFGGIYEAQRTGGFQKRGLNVQLNGGPGAPTVSMVIAGKTPFAIASADEVVIARSQGEDVVALFATYQTNPQGIMVHAKRGLKSLADLFSSPGTFAREPGLPYVQFLEKKYGFGKLNVVPYNYSIAPWLKDENMAVQCFVFAEPISAKQAGADPQVFLVADSGYNPYTAVVITRGDYARAHAETIKSMTEALREGWASYLSDPSATNAMMGQLNKEMDAATFKAAAESQVSLIRGGGKPIGEMTVGRWQELVEQLADLKIITKKPAAQDCFVQ